MAGVAEAVSDLFGDIGFAFVEERHVEALAGALRDFLAAHEIPINERRVAAYYDALEDQVQRRAEGPTGSAG